MQTKALNNLKKAKEILDEAGVTFWLEAGTLLLAYRDNKVDITDIDLSVEGIDIDRVEMLIPKFLKKGFKLEHIFQYNGMAREITFKRNGVNLDIWGKWIRDDQMWWVSYNFEAEDPSRIYIPHHVSKEYIDTLGTIFFKGLKLNIPYDTEGYLEANYGKEWRIPDPDWVWWRDPKSIDFNFKIE